MNTEETNKEKQLRSALPLVAYTAHGYGKSMIDYAALSRAFNRLNDTTDPLDTLLVNCESNGDVCTDRLITILHYNGVSAEITFESDSISQLFDVSAALEDLHLETAQRTKLPNYLLLPDSPSEPLKIELERFKLYEMNTEAATPRHLSLSEDKRKQRKTIELSVQELHNYWGNDKLLLGAVNILINMEAEGRSQEVALHIDEVENTYPGFKRKFANFKTKYR